MIGQCLSTVPKSNFFELNKAIVSCLGIRITVDPNNPQMAEAQSTTYLANPTPLGHRFESIHILETVEKNFILIRLFLLL
jgi:hypothetical protein